MPRQAFSAIIQLRLALLVCISLMLLLAGGKQRQRNLSSPALCAKAEAAAEHEEKQQAKQQQQPKPQHERAEHRPVYVDTKYWLRSTEFGERDNWRNQLRPCTLFERIKMNERAVVSMGTAMDALEGGSLKANIRDFSLAWDGILLLEEDMPESVLDYAFAEYIKMAGECTDSDSIMERLDSGGGGSFERHLFEFEPDSDLMSWFNPINWASAMNEYEIEEWVPESHRIPCSEDVVVLGDRHRLLEPVLETGERAQTVTFKVNFRPSEAAMTAKTTTTTTEATAGNELAGVKVDAIRISRLLIGSQRYDQREFEQLIGSQDYANILFQFNDTGSVLKAAADTDRYLSSPLIIDESSLVRDSSQNICLDEAGCLCGNERPEVMKVICSFNLPLADDDLPCHDPIYSAGYCNKICATTLTISMDPSRFSERFVGHIIEKLMDDDAYAGRTVFVGPRRIDDTKYEIVFRYAPEWDEDWWGSGVERNFANLVQQQLERGSTRSFYGIKTITRRSSVRWRRNNRSLIFWLTSLSLSMLSLAVLARKSADDFNQNSTTNTGLETEPDRWFTTIWNQIKQSKDPAGSGSESFMRFAEPSTLDRTDSLNGSLSNIPLMELDENEDKSE